MQLRQMKKIFAINSLKLLGTEEAYLLLKEMNLDPSNPPEVSEKLESSLDYFDRLIKANDDKRRSN